MTRMPRIPLVPLTAGILLFGKPTEFVRRQAVDGPAVQKSPSRCLVSEGQVSGRRSVPAQFRLVDSSVFDPGGYYFPIEPITQDGCSLSSVELHVVDYYYDGALHY